MLLTRPPSRLIFPGRPPPWPFVLLALSVVTLLVWISIQHHAGLPFKHATQFGGTASEDSRLPCASLPGADDVLVVMKTGATEANRKVPIHLTNTFRCIPHYIIYSSLAESIDGQPIYDALDEVSPELRNTHPDFALYRQLHNNTAPPLSTLSPQAEADAAKAAWDLDRWKFFPVLSKAYAHRPTAKWFLFIEADTYLSWPNALALLARFPPTRPHYLGSLHQFGDQDFHHGGAGFALSQPALARLARAYAADQPHYEALTAEFNAGDAALGKALQALGVRATETYPSVQGETPATLEYTAEFWCRPAVSYHHVSPAEVAQLWRFERGWFEEAMGRPFTHGDVFKAVVQQELVAAMAVGAEGRKDWDSLAGDVIGGEVASAEACGRVCLGRDECLLWSFTAQSSECRLGTGLRLGQQRSGVRSGWIPERIRQAREDLGDCDEAEWP